MYCNLQFLTFGADARYWTLAAGLLNLEEAYLTNGID
jgi:hypothetical protein